MPEKHTILGGKVHVYRRDNSSLWQCSTYLAGKNRRVSTKEDGLAKAKDFAEDWFLGLRGKVRNGEITSEKTFREDQMWVWAEAEFRGSVMTIWLFHFGFSRSVNFLGMSWPVMRLVLYWIRERFRPVGMRSPAGSRSSFFTFSRSFGS